MAATKISDGALKSSLTGTEMIPVSGSGKPAINTDLIRDYIGTWVDWTPVFTGFSVNPTVDVAKYCKIGNLCFMVVALSGSSTSNATTFTMTAPFNAAVAHSASFALPIDNGSPQAAGFLTFTAGSNVISLNKSAGAAWTASGVKRGRFEAFYITE